MRHQRQVAVVAVVAVITILAAACGGAASASPRQAVLGAAGKTLDARSAQVRFSLQPSQPGTGPASDGFTGTGSYDFANAKGSLNLSLPGLSLPGLRNTAGPTKAVLDGPAAYLNLPQLAQTLPGKSWLKIDIAAPAQTSTGLGALQGLADPAVVLPMANGTVSATRGGTDQLGGVTTTRYHVVLDLNLAASSVPAADRGAYDRLVAALGPSNLDADIWLDADGRLVQISFAVAVSQLPTTTAPASSGPLTYTLQLTDLGGPTVTASAPPADQTVAPGQVTTTTPTTTTTTPPTTTPRTTPPTSSYEPCEQCQPIPSATTTTTTTPAALSHDQFVAQADQLCQSVRSEVPTDTNADPSDLSAIAATLGPFLQYFPGFLAQAQSLVATQPDQAALEANWLAPINEDFTAVSPLVQQFLAAYDAGQTDQAQQLVGEIATQPDHSSAVAAYLNGYGLTTCAALESS